LRRVIAINWNLQPDSTTAPRIKRLESGADAGAGAVVKRSPENGRAVHSVATFI
jgi:hypothetical protein